MPVPHCFEFVLPDAAATDGDTWESVLMNLHASLRAPHLRLLSYINPVDADEFEAVRRAQMALQKSDMGRRFIEQEARLLSLSLRQRENSAWSLRHYLLTWGRAPAALGAYLRPNAYPPNPLVAPATLYAERLNYLHPLASGLPYVTVLGSYHFQRDTVWTWHNPWADLLTRADGPMLIAVDAVRVTEERLRLMRRGLEATAKVNNDPDMAKMAMRAEDALQQGEEAYEMRVFLMLTDTRLENLHQRAECLDNAYEHTILPPRMAGQQ